MRVELAADPQAASDDQRCERREHWLVRRGGDLLLVADCAAQWGADSQGPADVKLDGPVLSVKYVEFQEDDRCETVAAVVDLRTLVIEKQARRVGAVSGDRCKDKQPATNMPEPGDGSRARPVVVLHRE